MKLSPFDPFATFDEIQRLVPSYAVSRFELLSGTEQHVHNDLVQIGAAPASSGVRADLVLPANDTLFTSGTLGRYSKILHSVLESREHKRPAEATAAD
jgi:NADH-quinone oxidoreductase subunit G